MDVVLRREFEARRAKATETPVPFHERFREADGSNDPVIRRACDVEMNRNDPRGDGDQSPLSGFPGSPGSDLEMLWGCGGNFNPFERPDRYSTFLKNCAWGDAREVEATLALAHAACPPLAGPRPPPRAEQLADNLRERELRLWHARERCRRLKAVLL